MKMHVWTDRYSFLAVAHSDSVSESRELLLEQIGTTDGSTPEITRARECVLGQNPNIWMGKNAEFAITDSAEVERLEGVIAGLRAQLAAAAETGITGNPNRRVAGPTNPDSPVPTILGE